MAVMGVSKVFVFIGLVLVDLAHIARAQGDILARRYEILADGAGNESGGRLLERMLINGENKQAIDETTDDDRPESSPQTVRPESMKRFSEFLGGKKRYSEFLGGKKRYSEFLGGKKRYSEFLGGKKRYSEFLGGKKRYSEFLGGKKRFIDAFGPTEGSRYPYAAAAKRFSEFLGGK